MKKINCNHCQLKCKTHRKTECSNYNAISERPNQLPVLIREAINNKDSKKAKELKEELDAFYYGR